MLKLSNVDYQVLAAALRENSGYHYATKWYLDWEPLGYQYAFHHIPIKNSTFLAGIGSGKTQSVTASNIIDCLSLPGFRALNASITAKQAELAFQMLDTWKENSSRFANTIVDIGLRPYPQVTFWNGSTYEFRTAGQGAKFIRGSEYDRINYDEPGLDPDGEAIRVLRGRLRGKRPDGSSRMARMDVTGTPTAAPWFRERFENGLRGGQFSTKESLKFYRSMRITTYDNTHLTGEQIALIEAEYPPEMVAVEMRAEWPDFGISTFPHGHIQACVDRDMNDEMDMALRPDGGKIKGGYEEEEWPRVGHVFWKTPAKNGHIYVMAGDPGVDVPPRRNSPGIMVFDITTMPARMVYFHWASGRGSYDPFLQSYRRAVEEYRPIAKGIDATGTQKALADLGFEKYGIQMDSIHFGGQKDELINSLLVAITSHDLRFPSIQGLISQLQNYNREDDKDVAQDLVMTIAQIAFLMRRTTGDTRVNAPKKSNFFNRLKRTSNSGRVR